MFQETFFQIHIAKIAKSNLLVIAYRWSFFQEAQNLLPGVATADSSLK